MSGSLESAIRERVEALGYEFVELEQAGSKARPVLRVRADRQDAGSGEGIGLDELATISRALESYLDELAGVPEKYVLEVSSPGVERPLVRPRDFERFAGHEIALKGYGPLAGRSRRLEGELLGLAAGGEEEAVRLKLADGEEIEVPRSEIARAHLVFRWND